MKPFRYSLLIVMTILSFTGISQNIPLLDTGRIWSCWWDASAGGGGQGGYRLRLGDKVDVGNLTYYYLKESYNLYPDEWFQTQYMLREDSSGKVWLNNIPWAYEYLLYDFSLTPGDTIGNQRCDSIDTVFIGDTYRKRLYLSCDLWIEGLGSTRSGLMFPGQSCLVGMNSDAVCVHEHGNLVFQHYQWPDCLPVSLTYSPYQWTPTNQTHWHYDYLEENPWGSVPNEGYIYITTVKDTTITGHSCKKLMSTTYDHLGQVVRIVPFYTYADGQKIYYSLNSSFSVLYDFGAQAGDSWTIRNPFEIYGLSPEPDSVSVITVDSVGAVWNLFPIMYKQVYTHSSTSWFFKEAVMVRSGGDGFLFPGKWNDWNYPCPGLLRCYEDGMMWGFQHQNPCDQLITGITNMYDHQHDFLLVNPVIGDFKVICTGNSVICGKAILYDNQGRQISSASFTGEREIIIPTGKLAPGMYFIKIFREGSVSVCLKAVKLL